MIRTARNLVRLLGIARTLARHDVLFLLEEAGVPPWVARVARPLAGRVRAGGAGAAGGRPGQRLARALQELGPTFIKIGQTLATRADLLGEEMVADLSGLQDRLPPFPAAEARATIEAELGRPLAEIFVEFDEVPVAAASIAQVHFARLPPDEPEAAAADADAVEEPAADAAGDGPDGPAGDDAAGDDAAGDDAPENGERPANGTRPAARLFGDSGAPAMPREVAVKVLRPGIEAAFRRDLELFRWLAALVERALPEARRLKPAEVVETFAETVAIEMDLRMEAAAASELAENFADDPWFRVPAVDWERTARRVLTTERVTGIPLDERERIIAAGHDVDVLMERSASAFFKQVFQDGFFHADQHPGNCFVMADGTLAVVDFGIMGRLDRPTRTWLADMLLGFLMRDYRRVAEVHFEAGYVPADQSVGAFTQALRSIGEPILGLPVNRISIARLLGQMFSITAAFRMETQPQLLLLQKTMMVTEGVGRTLCPEVNMWELAAPLIERWMRQNRGPEARIRKTAEELATTLRRLPKLVANTEAAAGRLASGGLALHPETVRALTGDGRKNPLLWPLWIATGLIAVGVLAILAG